MTSAEHNGSAVYLRRESVLIAHVTDARPHACRDGRPLKIGTTGCRVHPTALDPHSDRRRAVLFSVTFQILISRDAGVGWS